MCVRVCVLSMYVCICLPLCVIVIVCACVCVCVFALWVEDVHVSSPCTALHSTPPPPSCTPPELHSTPHLPPPSLTS